MWMKCHMIELKLYRVTRVVTNTVPLYQYKNEYSVFPTGHKFDGQKIKNGIRS